MFLLLSLLFLVIGLYISWAGNASSSLGMVMSGGLERRSGHVCTLSQGSCFVYWSEAVPVWWWTGSCALVIMDEGWMARAVRWMM